MDVTDYEFNVGDEVITVDGRSGKIVSICDCEMCKSRGFLEPFWLPIEGGTEECISICHAQDNFSGYHRIGKYVFNDFDKIGVQQRINEHESEVRKLIKMLEFIEAQEHKFFNPEKALRIVDSIGLDMYGDWKIPHYYKPCNDDVELSNGETVKCLMKDEVYTFLDYIKVLIRKEINHE
jgi:hypothetical protein